MVIGWSAITNRPRRDGINPLNEATIQLPRAWRNTILEPRSPPISEFLIDAASKAAYWGTVAAHVDPDSAAQTDSQKLVDLLFNAAPSLKPKVEAMLAIPTPPSY